MKRTKQFLSVLLALMMIFSIIPMASIEASAAYENTYVNTGNQRADIIGVAKTQIGYVESGENDTKYGDWYGLPGEAWCAMFVSWCANQAGIPTSVLKKTARAHPDNFGIPYYDGASYTPQAGDLFFTKSFGHVGLVYYVDGNYFYTIEGNWSDKVLSQKRKISDFYFGVPDYTNTVKPTLSLSTNTVNLTLGGTESATVVIDIINDNGNCDIEVDGNNSNCYNTLWQVWQEGEEYFECDIDAKATGTTIFTVKLIDLSNNTVIESKKITAYVSAKTYTVSYNANGGTGAPSSQTKTHGTTLTLSNTIPTRTGYTFLGWSTSSTATTATYSAGSSFTTNANTTLYAVWKADRDSYIHIWVSDSIFGDEPSKYYVGVQYWICYEMYDKNTGDNLNSYISGGYDVTITAYDPYGDIVFTGNTLSNTDKDGFSFKPQYEGEYKFVVSVEGVVSGEFTETIEVESIPVKTYTVSYNANGGTGAPSSQTNIHGTVLTLSNTIPTRTGYTFLGWSESSTATTATYQPGDSFTTNADITLYAVWQKDSVTPDEPEYNYTLSIQEPSRITIRNRDGIILHANVEGIAPAGSYVEWTSNNNNFDIDESADGTKLTAIAENKGYTTFTATLYDAEGNILATDNVELYSKSGFFDKIGGFFRSLFGSTKIYEN